MTGALEFNGAHFPRCEQEAETRQRIDNGVDNFKMIVSILKCLVEFHFSNE